MKYFYQHPDWSQFYWDRRHIDRLVQESVYLQGKLNGKISGLDKASRQIREGQTLTEEVLSNFGIENQKLDPEQVRSSVIRKMNPAAKPRKPNRLEDAAVDILWDAVKSASKPLTRKRLFDWHRKLFDPRLSPHHIVTDQWRTGRKGPMQIVSGRIGRETVHYEAPPTSDVPRQMELFFAWINGEGASGGPLYAAIAHLWFVSIHPFKDGNGRLARAITEMLLARTDTASGKYYSMSGQILPRRKQYYDILEQTQKGNLDITGWLEWFLDTLKAAILASDRQIDLAIRKQRFWQTYGRDITNPRQRKIIEMLLDDNFRGHLTTSKWAKINKCSPDTALRDIKELLARNILVKAEKGGRSTHYLFNSELEF